MVSDGDSCNPSLGMQPGTRKDNEYTQLQSAALVMGLNQGWITAVVDDTGPQGVFSKRPPQKSPYSDMRPASGLHGGRTTLDGIRAVLNSANVTGIEKDPIITLYGYSGGAFAGQWVGSRRLKCLESNMCEGRGDAADVRSRAEDQRHGAGRADPEHHCAAR
jgi:Secretory lipase